MHDYMESPLPALDPNVVENVTITQFVTKKIAEYGERDSLIDAFTGKVIKFNEILPTIKRVGAGFQKHGVKYDDVVFLCLPNCIEYAIIFHALGSIGATMTTTNPQYTQHELEHQFKDSTAKFIVTTPPLFHKLSELAKNQNIPVFAIHGDIEGAVSYETLLQSNEADIVEPSFDTKDKVLVIPYSSGTTGLPKGVCLTHYNIVCNVEQVIKIEHEVTPTDVFIGFLPLFHIYAMVVILNLSIALGVKTILMERFDLPKYLEIIQTHKVTYSHLVPPIAVLLAKHQIVPNYDLSSLKVIFSGAAPLSESLQNNVTQRLGNSIVVKQAFGMTETSPAISISPTSKSKHGSCGVLVPSLQAKIISTENGAVLGVGETGEIIVRGPNIMKCYFNLPEATAGIMDSEGFLHTGDVGHFDEEGYLYITDRVKELIKFKGFQVAPAELEAVLLTIHDIADAAVIGKPDEEAGELPRAYIVRKPGSTITEEEINKVVDAEVAHYKRLKGGIIFVDAIPKSPTGKILRRVLKARMIEEEAEKAI